MRSFKFLVIFAFVSMNSGFCFAQLKYQKSYKETVSEAINRKLPIFISIEYNTQQNLPEQFFRDDFVNYRVKYDSPEGNMLAGKYGLTRFPVLLFTRPDGSLILKSEKIQGDRQYFVLLSMEAVDRFKEHTGLADYDRRYEQGTDINRAFLKDYIDLRINSGIFENDKLIDHYVDFLGAGSQNSYDEILFIHRAAPVLDGKAFKFARKNSKLVDSIYQKEPLQDRIWINTRIIGNTLAEAIRKKDHTMYNNLSDFVYSTVAPDYTKIEAQSALNYLIFFKGTNDTAGFLRQAPAYYDRFFMSVGLDSIKRAKLNQSKSQSVNAQSSIVRLGHLSVGTFHDRDVLNTAFVLNNAAWDFYTFGAKDPVLLAKAMAWSQRSIEIDPKATHYDTLAHLLYRMGLFDGALFYEEKAIRLARKNNELSQKEIKGFKEEAQKMKKRVL